MSDRFIRVAAWLTDKYILLMLLVFPSFVGFQGYVNITLSKYLFFVIASSVWLAAVVILCILSKQSLQFRRWEAIALGFAIWSAVSSLMSPHVYDTLVGASRYDGLLTIVIYVGIFIFVSRFGVWRRLYAWVTAAALTVCCAVSLFQLLGFSIFYPNEYTYYDAGVMYISKFLGTIGNTNLLAAYLCMGIVLLAALFALSSEKSVILLAASVFGVFVMVASESAGGITALVLCALCSAALLAKAGALPRAFFALGALAIGASAASVFSLKIELSLGMAAAALALLFIGWIIREKVDISQYKSLALIMAACTCAALILTAYFWQGREGSIFELSQLLHGEVRDEFGSSRILIWRRALELVKERLIFGGGPDTLALRLDLTFSRYYEELGKTLITYADNAHNVYLGYLVNLGLPGLCIYLALIAVTLQRIFESEQKHVVAIGCALICAWAEGFFGLGLCLVAPIMWIFWGLIFGRSSETYRTTEVQNNDETEKTEDIICSDHNNADTVFGDGQAIFEAGKQRTAKFSANDSDYIGSS